MRGRRIQIGLVALFLLLSPFIQVQSMDVTEESIYEGPFLDKILFKSIAEEDQVVLALENNEIDLIGDVVDPSYLPEFEEEPLQFANVLRNGYGLMSFNCEKYPFNISQFRRAVAYAVDKNAIVDDIWDGLAAPLDSLVPQQNPLSIEGDVSFSYYEADNDTAITILDSLGFHDINEDGYRELPNGTQFDVRLDYPSSSNIAMEVIQAFVDAYLSIGINATAYVYDYYLYDLYAGLYDDFDMVLTARGFGSTFSLEWMGYPFFNYITEDVSRWSNESYNDWGKMLLNASTYEEVGHAAEEMQRIWLEECPYIVAYQNMHINAYRDDTFTGFVNDVLAGIPGFWTYFKAREDSDPIGHIGGTLRVSIPLWPEDFNLMATASASIYFDFFNLLYDSLLRCDPNGNPIPWLATNYAITTTADEGSIPLGHCRIAFDILDNATWSDGEPLTAEDVRYCLTYYRDSENNPLGVDLQGLTAAYTPTDSRVVFEFNTTSYWNLYTIGNKPIMPKHTLQELGLSGWDEWDPDPLNGELVTSGPFNISDYVADDYIELTRNPDYFYQPPMTPTDTSDGTGPPTLLDMTLLISIAAVGLIMVVVVLVVCRRSR